MSDEFHQEDFCEHFLKSCGLPYQRPKAKGQAVQSLEEIII